MTVEPSSGQRMARTAAQSGAALAVVVIVEWALTYAGLDLDPDTDGTGLPVAVSAAFQGLLTWAAAVWMNRRRPAPAGALPPRPPPVVHNPQE